MSNPIKNFFLNFFIYFSIKFHYFDCKGAQIIRNLNVKKRNQIKQTTYYSVVMGTSCVANLPRKIVFALYTVSSIKTMCKYTLFYLSLYMYDHYFLIVIIFI